ncbi:MAG: NADH-quinone oxidoreductase subunit L [Thermoflavifilum sp.]|nr:NADH-quinone oxidoreductase subunit L [Thermoflavifilum sp.]MCL6513203.1 NADH-quinone oxidoreductase subunit L [Alicyclobacillus sp.]
MVWWIPGFPLIAFAITLLVGRRLAEPVVAGIAVMATLISFVLSTILLLHPGTPGAVTQLDWLTVGQTHIGFGMQTSHLNALMAFVVSLVSTLVLLYSRGYMAGDERFSVYYQYLNLFVFSMLGLVLSANLLELYIFWEMVGLCSYLLVGFWFFKPEAALAAKKSFIVTRIGDTGLFAGIVLLWLASGSFNFDAVFQAAQSPGFGLGWLSGSGLITLVAILVFLGAVGKSAQFPLHVWLPDAMEGPTPVSALIHAATMVAAGVYLVARMFPLFALSHAALTTVAWIGGVTALLAALIALTQRDIKRVIAYSTVSQLGYMMMALGAGAYAYGVFHLFTHAFFKALLFLTAGSVIHALGGEQDLFKMGGLAGKLPITRWTFLAAALALAGIFPLSGFWSKDAILTALLAGGHGILYAVGLITAFCTAFYIFRLYFLAFAGTPRDEALYAHAHEGGWVMTVPQVVLGVLAVMAGWWNTPIGGHPIERYLLGDAGTSFFAGTSAGDIGHVYPENVLWMVISLVVALAGIGLAAWMYGARADQRAAAAASAAGPLYRVSLRKFYLDEIYESSVVRAGKWLARIADGLDRFVIQSIVYLASRMTYAAGWGLRLLQTGQVQTYGVVAALGLFVLIAIAMLRGGVM